MRSLTWRQQLALSLLNLAAEADLATAVEEVKCELRRLGPGGPKREEVLKVLACCELLGGDSWLRQDASLCPYVDMVKTPYGHPGHGV